jgi:PAS domain S-box-containing protein
VIALEHSELFHVSPLPILCEDWSQVRLRVMEVLASGVTDFDAFLRENPDFAYEVRKVHRVVDSNPATQKAFGVASHEDLMALVPKLLPANPASNNQVLRAIARGETDCRGERILTGQNGKRIPILWRTRLPKTQEGFEKLYFFAIDISEQKQVEQDLAEARAALHHAGRISIVGELAASLAHEMTQPLSAIITDVHTASNFLARPEPDVTRTQALVQRIGKRARHAVDTVRNIKKFSQSKTAALTPSDIFGLIKESVALVEHSAIRAGVAIEMQIGPDLPRVLCDPVRIQQVFVNIILNAIQAIESSGQDQRVIRLTSAVQGGNWVIFTIQNSGPIIPPDTLDAIFTPFFTTKPEGVGLGLAISKRIAEDHQGHLWAENTPHGAQFHLRLPIL